MTSAELGRRMQNEATPDYVLFETFRVLLDDAVSTFAVGQTYEVSVIFRVSTAGNEESDSACEASMRFSVERRSGLVRMYR